jgi:hypothetical protein
MTDRIDDYLERRIPREMLTAGERLEADVLDRAIRETREFLGSRQAPDLRLSIMAALSPDPRAATTLVGRLAALVWKPRQVTIRPAWALAVLVLTAAAVRVPVWPVGDARGGASAHVADRIFVEFRLHAAASSVQLAGSFTNWQPIYDLHQVAPDQWSVSVPLTQGVHDYAFVVDGTRWVADPFAAAVADGFGGVNSRVTLLSSNAPQT